MKRKSMTFRVTDSLLTRVKTNAEMNGRSISEEVEMILERSAWEDDLRKKRDGT